MINIEFLKCDRMAADCAFELKKENVAFVSLWPGAVRTEAIMEKINSGEMDSKVCDLEVFFNFYSIL